MNEQREYLVTCNVKARGTQCWSVKANNEDDAMAKAERGQGEFVSEEFDVTDLKAAKAELNE